MNDKPETETAQDLELVAFRVGNQEFCIDIMSVREIRGWTPATPIPHAPKFVRGVINLRGAVLPIVDLAARLGLPSVDPTARHVTIVTQVGDRLVGLLVEAVSDILSLDPEMIQPTPDVASAIARTFLKGVVAIEGRMINIITLEAILPAEREAA
jgi:purine-binding chemotaxis protein CheW